MAAIRTTSVLDARERLQDGGIVAIPTETVYGLAAIAENAAAVKKIFTLKARPFFDPLIVHIGDWDQLETAVQGFSPEEMHLARTFWPGPLTIVSPKKPIISDVVTSGYDTVAVRMPRHVLTLELLAQLRMPLVAPSANQFGKTSPTTPEHVAGEFIREDILILDGGSCEVGIESTVIQLRDGTLSILRPGGITAAQLEAALVAGGFSVRTTRAHSAQSPGHLKHHYQPGKPLIVASRMLSSDEIAQILGKPTVKVEECLLPEDPVLAARTIYSALRDADKKMPDAIFLHWRFPKDGLWEAIWDRIQRAAELILE